MKNTSILLNMAAGAMVFLFSGCSKQETSASNPANPAPQTTSQAAPESPRAVEKPKAANDGPVAETPNQEAPAQVASSANNSVSQSPEKTAEAPKSSAEEKAAQPVNAPATALTTNAIVPLANAAESLIASQKLTAAQAATNQLQALGQTATNQAQSAALSATNQVQGLIEKAKGLASNQKYQDALNTVQQLYTTKLTPDQQKAVDGLRAQIQAAMTKTTASNATSILGGILGGKK